jgi:hypothetical protein
MKTQDIVENNVNISLDPAVHQQPDHEVQMARSDLHRAAQSSIKLHEMLKKISESQGLEGWVQAKITKAADYLESVYHYLDYEMRGDKSVEMEAVIPGTQPPGMANTTAPAAQNPGASLAMAAKSVADAKRAKQAQIKALQTDIQAKQKQIADLNRTMNMPATVAENKKLGKRVRIVSGHDAGKYGWIREIQPGQFKGAPRKFDVDLDDGGQANGLPDTALRLAKEPTSMREAASAGASSAGGVATAMGGNGFKHGGPGTVKRAKQPTKEARVLPDLTAKQPEGEHSKQYLDRVKQEKEKKIKSDIARDMKRTFGKDEKGNLYIKWPKEKAPNVKEDNESMPSGAKAAHTMGLAHGAKGTKKIDALRSFGVYSKWYHRGYEQAADSDEWREKQKLLRASSSKRGVNNENIGQTKLDPRSDPNLRLTTTENEFNEVVQAFQNWAKTNGWKIKKYKHSAMLDYEAKNAKGDTVVLSVWHGTGSYGYGKAILTLYVGSKATDLLDVLDVKWAGPWGYFTSDSAKTQYLNNLARLLKMLSSNFKNMQEEVEKLDELSKKKVKDYISKNFKDIHKYDDDTEENNRKVHNRSKGLERALDKRDGNSRVKVPAKKEKTVDRLTKDETQLDELSKKTLSSYIKKAQSDIHSRAAITNSDFEANDFVRHHRKKSDKRSVGIDKAANKLDGQK